MLYQSKCLLAIGTLMGNLNLLLPVKVLTITEKVFQQLILDQIEILIDQLGFQIKVRCIRFIKDFTKKS